MSFIQKVQNIVNSRFFKYGAPFFICIIGASFTVQQFAQLKVDFTKKRLINPKDLEQHGVTMKDAKEVTIDKEFEKVKSINIDNWENKRGPRPWEEGVTN